ncbi:MAG: hypothetical protein QW472_01735 [Candidatus Aenigmatarchaeota archaeon]
MGNRIKKTRRKGFVICIVLLLSLVLVLIASAGVILSGTSLTNLGLEFKKQKAEKGANYALMDVLYKIYNGEISCSNVTETSITYNIDEVNVEVRGVKGGETCFLWVKAKFKNAQTVKTAIVAESIAEIAPLMSRRFDNFNLDGSSAIISCEKFCKTSGVLTGYLDKSQIPPAYEVIDCPTRTGRGVYATLSPVVYINDKYQNEDFTKTIFNADNREELLDKLSEIFRVKLTNGSPDGIIGEYDEVVNNNYVKGGNFDVCGIKFTSRRSIQCTAKANTIMCTGYNVVIKWDTSSNKYIINDIAYCSALDFEENVTINLVNFSGGGIIASGDFVIAGDVGNERNLTLIARNRITDNKNNSFLKNVYIFSQNVYIDDNRIFWDGGLIYTGGKGSSVLDIQSRSQIGTPENPVLIISDNELKIDSEGGATIYGVVFATKAAQKTEIILIGSKIQGAIISNSLSNTFYTSGKSLLYFDFGVIKNLSEREQILKTPSCNNGRSFIFSYVQSKASVY